MKRRTLKPRTGPRLVSQTSATLPHDEPEEYVNADPPAGQHQRRGVFTCPYRATSGFLLLVVVNGCGDRLLEVPVLRCMDEEQVTIELRAWLDSVDPLPKKRDEKPITIIRALRLVQ